MANPFSSRPLSELSVEDLQNRASLLKAVVYVAGAFMLVMIGYNIAVVVFQKVNSFGDLVARNMVPMGGFSTSILLSFVMLKKIKAEISSRG